MNKKHVIVGIVVLALLVPISMVSAGWWSQDPEPSTPVKRTFVSHNGKPKMLGISYGYVVDHVVYTGHVDGKLLFGIYHDGGNDGGWITIYIPDSADQFYIGDKLLTLESFDGLKVTTSWMD